MTTTKVSKVGRTRRPRRRFGNPIVGRCPQIVQFSMYIFGILKVRIFSKFWSVKVRMRTPSKAVATLCSKCGLIPQSIDNLQTWNLGLFIGYMTYVYHRRPFVHIFMHPLNVVYLVIIFSVNSISQQHQYRYFKNRSIEGNEISNTHLQECF